LPWAGRGTDVAREASDDFGSVVKAVRLGRRIYDNLRKAIGFIFAVHVPIARLALLPLIFGLPIIFSPIHIAFLEMVIDPGRLFPRVTRVMPSAPSRDE
jgi:P-type Ca2+ transporter type 2C